METLHVLASDFSFLNQINFLLNGIFWNISLYFDLYDNDLN